VNIKVAITETYPRIP